MGNRLIDLSGERFGKLLVTSRAGSDWQKGATWYCNCDCGKSDVVIRGTNLRDGVSTSCGCMIAPSIVGKKFNMLTVISEEINENKDKYCVCQCDCGNIKTIARGHILSSAIKSCGCLKRIKEDLVGQKFGRLTVLERARVDDNRKVYWLCLCECGNTKEILGRGLKQGGTKSCGCLNRERSEEQVEDLKGQRFGRLIVIEIVRKRISKGRQRVYWKCLCDCGNEKVIAARNLKNGGTLSCGCYRDERLAEARTKGVGEHSIHSVYYAYKHSAKARGLEFNIDEKDLKILTSYNCFYCGRKPGNLQKSLCNTGDYLYNGIDRVDNNVGYIMSNVVPCCHFCNWSKRDRTKEDFLLWIKDVYNQSVKDKDIYL